MPTTSVFVANFCILLLLCVSALMSASEIAYFSLTGAELDGMRESEDATDNRVADLLDRPRYLLSTILVTNNLVNIGMIILAYFVTRKMFNFADHQIGTFFIPGYIPEFIWNVM